ncbi:NAD(P)-dependent oxidoreductase [Alteribacillus sp. HJP-4]|uniref:NAD(P)-dependent oxidoreductase n=1 Tax=Alteribacillus sp. HJP-4 TaxID=2775394 RepID=UPI0035CCC87F
MRAALLGATGRTGKVILEQLLQMDISVTALAREPEKLSEVRGPITIIQGNALNDTCLSKASDNADFVISALSTDKSNTLQRVVPLLINTMSSKGINRLITIGTAGILCARNNPSFYRFHTKESKRKNTTAARDHAKAYEKLRASNLEWTILCPTYLIDGPETGRYRTEKDYLPINGKKISTGDTAACAVSLLEERKWSNCRIGISY